MPAQYLHTSGAVTRLQNSHTGLATYCLNNLYMFWFTEVSMRQRLSETYLS